MMTQEHGDLNQTALVERVFELTQAMEHAAEMADWELAARLGQERSPLVKSIGANQQPASRELIDRIRTIGDSITKNAALAQSELTAEFREAMSRVGAAKAYNRAAMF